MELLSEGSLIHGEMLVPDIELFDLLLHLHGEVVQLALNPLLQLLNSLVWVLGSILGLGRP